MVLENASVPAWSAGEAFGPLLRRLRVNAALTQEQLAKRAGVSPNGVAALEAGRRRVPRLTTIAMLADALQLDDEARASLVAAAGASAGLVDPAANRTAAPSGPPPTEGHPSVFAPAGGWRHPFVGRAPQLERLLGAFDARRRVVLLSGEAGLGKTRLADQFADTVRAAGAVVLGGRWTPEWLGPFAGFVTPVRQAAARVDPEKVAGRGELLRLAPELAERFGAAAPTKADAGVEQRLLFEAVSSLLAQAGPVLLTLDDLQWADPTSLSLMAYLAADYALADLVMLCTLRSTDVSVGTAGALADLGRVCEVEQLTLDGLDAEDIGQLVSHIAGGAAPASLVETVVRASEGNAFFAEELAEHLLSAGSSGKKTDQGGVSDEDLPARIRDTISRRVATLSPDGQAFLQAAAVLGRQFEPVLAGRVAVLDDERSIVAAEDALLSGLVAETSPSTMAFSHSLVQTAIDARLSALRRVDLHRRAADLLAQSEPHDPADVARVTRHWSAVAAADRSAMPVAAYWTVRAGDAALAAAATEEAINRYKVAASLWSETTAEHADTLIRLGSALYSSGRTTEGDEQFRAALKLAQGLSDLGLETRAAFGLAKTLSYGEADRERVDALEGVLAHLEPTDPVWRPAAAALLVRQFTFDRSPSANERREELWAEVTEAVEHPNLPKELLLMLGGVSDFIASSEPEPLNRLSRQMIAVAREDRNLSVLANAWWGQAWSALERASRKDWTVAVTSYEQVASDLALPAQLGVAASLRSAEAQIEGRFDAAQSHAESALAQLSAAGDPNAEAVFLGRSVLFAFDLGRAGEMLTAMLALTGDFEHVMTFQAGLALTAALAGDRSLAARLLGENGAMGFRELRQDVERLAVLTFFAHTCVILEDAEHAGALYDALSATAAVGVRVGPIAGWWGAVDHHLGALCRVLGRHEEASRRLQHALEVETAMLAAPAQSRTQLELASVLERLDGAGDSKRAEELRSQAQATVTAFGLGVPA